MECRTVGCGYYNSIDGMGWPDYVMVENDGEVLKGTYDVREYFPVNIRALLALADEMETDGADCYTVSTQYVLDDYARRIREALGVER